MIEAIPLSSESIILIITKVEDPDELDTRFANFAPNIKDETDDAVSEIMKSVEEEMPEVLDLFRKISQEVAKNPEILEDAKEKIKKEIESSDLSKAFTFDSLSEVIKAAKVISKVYKGRNSLYRDDVSDGYVLSISKSDHTTEEFNKICNCLSEYGQMQRSTPATEAYFEEHGNCIVADNAIETLLK